MLCVLDCVTYHADVCSAVLTVQIEPLPLVPATVAASLFYQLNVQLRSKLHHIVWSSRHRSVWSAARLTQLLVAIQTVFASRRNFFVDHLSRCLSRETHRTPHATVPWKPVWRRSSSAKRNCAAGPRNDIINVDCILLCRGVTSVPSRILKYHLTN